MIQHIPFELQQLNQWVVASGAPLPNGDVDKKPRNPRTGALASVTDPDTWGSFSEAQASSHKLVGFVLSPDDPYTIIDLDDPRLNSEKKPETDAELVKARTQRHCKILEAFESYAEYSQSGGGIHIIVRGKIPKGCRKDRVEVYSEGRYMVCTGTPYNTLPITSQQDLLDKLFAEMATEREEVELVQRNSLISDADVCRMAYNASNGAKFWELWQGNWQGNPLYPSQSEADFALLSFLTFYTKDNEQVRRIFRTSALGKREKANKNDKYLNFALRKIRANELPAVDLSELLKRAASIQNKHSNGNHTGTNGTAPAKLPEAPQELPAPKKKVEKGFSYPPGFVGELARYFFESAVRPVPEIALVASMALCSGVLGRAYNVNGSGLNQYFLLVAGTGKGKDGIKNSIERMIGVARTQVPGCDTFIGPSIFASGQAISRVLGKQPCFVSMLGEFGYQMQELTDPRATSATRMLKKMFLDLYSNSGFGDVMRPSAYSDTEKNTQLVQAPCMTIVAESNPETLYDQFDSSLISDGFLPRFVTVEYNGPRPDLNPNAGKPPPKDLSDQFMTLCAMALSMAQDRRFCPVSQNSEAAAKLAKFEKWTTNKMNEGIGAVETELWNRAHLKALKLSALIAVGINPNNPVITAEVVDWVLAFVHAEIDALATRFASGQAGSGVQRQDGDLKKMIEDWIGFSRSRKLSYCKNVEVVNAQAIIPHAYLRKRALNLSSFKLDRRGPDGAVEALIKVSFSAGILHDISDNRAFEMFKTRAKIYMIGENWQ